MRDTGNDPDSGQASLIELRTRLLRTVMAILVASSPSAPSPATSSSSWPSR